jgi:protein subunit release factor B
MITDFELVIRDSDIIEKFVRSRGKGGQNLNKVSTCVYLKHIPTGIEVKCDIARTQAKNRELALSMLYLKIRKHFMSIEKEEEQIFEKEKRKNRKRPYKLKESILNNKHYTSRKKELRRKGLNQLKNL